MDYHSMGNNRPDIKQPEGVPAGLQPGADPIGRLLAALGDALPALQRARSPQHVYRAVDGQLRTIGCSMAVLEVTNGGRHLTLAHPDLTTARPDGIDRTAPDGLDLRRFPVVSGSVCARVLADGKAACGRSRSMESAGAQLGPQQSVPSGALGAWPDETTLYAPLRLDGGTRGLVVIAGPGLNEAHLPLATFLAAEIAAALTSIEIARASQQEQHERAHAIKCLQNSLAEKEALLKEIHHRVKNNLQVVSSLLSLEAMRAKDSDGIAAFRDSQGRIRSMALIHENLYRSWDLSKIDFGEYVPALVDALLQVYGDPARRITWHIDVRDVFLAMETAIPCGLILNELISNCLKHAFPSGKAGHVGVTFYRDPDGRYALEVSDDGVGLPSGLDFTSARTLGLQLIHMLSQQLQGSVEMPQGAGTTVRVTFEQEPDGVGRS